MCLRLNEEPACRWPSREDDVANSFRRRNFRIISQQKALSSNPARRLPVWSLHVLPVSAWVPSALAGFPQNAHRHALRVHRDRREVASG